MGRGAEGRGGGQGWSPGLSESQWVDVIDDDALKLRSCTSKLESDLKYSVNARFRVGQFQKRAISQWPEQV